MPLNAKTVFTHIERTDALLYSLDYKPGDPPSASDGVRLVAIFKNTRLSRKEATRDCVVLADPADSYWWIDPRELSTRQSWLVIPRSQHHEMPSFNTYLCMFPNAVALHVNELDNCTGVCEDCRRGLSCKVNLTSFAVGVRVATVKISTSKKALLYISNPDWSDHVEFKRKDVLANPFLRLGPGVKLFLMGQNAATTNP